MNNVVELAKDYVKKILSNESTGHDYLHSMRVYKMAIHLAEDKEVDLILISLAALLHDLDDYKIAKEGSKRALNFLNEHVNEKTKDKVMDIINNMSYSSFKKGKTVNCLEGKIVQDADRLDALGAIGIARTFAYSGKTNRPIYSENEGVESAISHFYDKLIKLENLMNLDEAKSIAKERTKFIYEYLEKFYQEI
ncbi:MAG: HD domain-containing protein [Candidatus Izemoplasmatales bacterium]